MEGERRDAGDGEVVSAEAEGPLPGPGSQHCRCCNRGAPAGAMTRQAARCVCTRNKDMVGPSHGQRRK